MAPSDARFAQDSSSCATGFLRPARNLGPFQLQSPIRCISAGTTYGTTNSASTRIANPSANPTYCSMLDPDVSSVRNVPPMTRPHRVMTDPAQETAFRIASSLDMPLSFPSLMRVVSRMS